MWVSDKVRVAAASSRLGCPLNSCEHYRVCESPTFLPFPLHMLLSLRPSALAHRVSVEDGLSAWGWPQGPQPPSSLVTRMPSGSHHSCRAQPGPGSRRIRVWCRQEKGFPSLVQVLLLPTWDKLLTLSQLPCCKMGKIVLNLIMISWSWVVSAHDSAICKEEVLGPECNPNLETSRHEEPSVEIKERQEMSKGRNQM